MATELDKYRNMEQQNRALKSDLTNMSLELEVKSNAADLHGGEVKALREKVEHSTLDLKSSQTGTDKVGQEPALGICFTTRHLLPTTHPLPPPPSPLLPPTHPLEAPARGRGVVDRAAHQN